MHTFETEGPVSLQIRNASGEIRVELTDTTTTTVDVSLVTAHPLGLLDDIVRALRRPDEHAERQPIWWQPPTGREADAVLAQVRVEFSRSGGTLVVDTDPASRGWRTAFNLHVTAPSNSSLRAASQSAGIRVSGTAESLDARTASGDVHADDIAGDARVATASGGIRLHSAGGELSCRSASGDIQAGSVAGRASLQTTSGDVRLATAGGDVEARTVSGDVYLADLATGLVHVTAVSGDVEIGLRPGTSAAVNLSTLSGTTRSDLEVADEPAVPDGDGGSARPGVDIQVRTTSGDIRLRRAATA